MKKGTKLYSILISTCPRCQEEKMYESGPYKLSKMAHMHKTCSNCGLRYEK